jgi:hypothetical protein
METVKGSPGVVKRITGLFNKLINSVWTLIPAVVESVDAADVKCDVAIKIRNTSRITLESVPVVFPKGGDAVLMSPINVGDVVLVAFTKYPTTGLLDDNKVVQNTNLDETPKFSINSPVILGGFTLSSDTRSIPTDGFELTGNLNVSGQTIQCPRMTSAERTTLTAGFTTADKGKMWFNETTSKWEGWDGSSIQVIGP